MECRSAYHRCAIVFSFQENCFRRVNECSKQTRARHKIIKCSWIWFTEDVTDDYFKIRYFYREYPSRVLCNRHSCRFAVDKDGLLPRIFYAFFVSRGKQRGISKTHRIKYSVYILHCKVKKTRTRSDIVGCPSGSVWYSESFARTSGSNVGHGDRKGVET